jgi:hypothetical protein
MAQLPGKLYPISYLPVELWAPTNLPRELAVCRVDSSNYLVRHIASPSTPTLSKYMYF